MNIPVFIRPAKPYSEAENQFLRDNFPTQTHKWMGEQLGRSVDSIKNRCRLLNLTRPAKNLMIVAAVRTGQKSPEGLDLAELPTHLQKWFGLAPTEVPLAAMPYTRRIEEKMPEFTVSKTKHHIGSGSQYQIGYLANL